ncbi:MAG: NAD-dependent epimerase/dehydratase family protein, partial [Nanoarchaeota archaeon]
TVFGEGSQVRDFTYVIDIAEATIRAHYSTKPDGKILNVGTQIPTRIIDVANKVLDLIPESKSRIEFKPMVRGDPMGCVADTSLLKATLNWLPSINLDQGAGRYIEWTKTNKNLIPKWV